MLLNSAGSETKFADLARNGGTLRRRVVQRTSVNSGTGLYLSLYPFTGLYCCIVHVSKHGFITSSVVLGGHPS